MAEKKVSKAQQKAVAKYESNNYDKYLIRSPKGKKTVIQEFAQSQGESLNAFVNKSIDERIERIKDETEGSGCVNQRYI